MPKPERPAPVAARGGAAVTSGVTRGPDDAAQPRPVLAGAGPLLERESELDHLTGLLDQVASGSGGALLVTGPAGIGKSSLLGAAEDLAAARGMLVLRAGRRARA